MKDFHDDNSTLPESPYRGIEPFRFTDNRIFFAREKEIRKLLRYVTIYRGVLFYGTSGVGKSSLINAGLMPPAIEEAFIPDRVRIQPQPGEEIIIERITKKDVGKDRFLPSNFTTKTNAKRVVLSVGSFEEKLRQLSTNGYPLLIFDQFEEFITLFEEAPRGKDLNTALVAQRAILRLIVDLLRDHSLPIKLLFVFREDYLAKLTKLFVLFPDLQDQYLRLAAPRTDSLHTIIHGPFEDRRLREHFGKELTKDLAEKLIQKIIERTEGDSINLTEVQIVCSELWQSSNPDLLFERKGIQGLLEDYTTNAIDKLASSHLKDPAIALLSRLVTPSGTRNIVSKEELISRVVEEEHIKQDILEKALDALEVKTKLIIRERRHGNAFYEIVSEFLIPWIVQQKTERLAQIQYRKWEDSAKRKTQRTEDQGQEQTRSDPQHLLILRTGVETWNQWRDQNPDIQPNLAQSNLRGVSLARANLGGADFSGASLRRVDLDYADLSGANLFNCDLRESNLESANLRRANLSGASLVAARLTNADLRRADLTQANLAEADLNGADLSYATMVDANLENANIENCLVYGTAAWNLNLDGARQLNLIVTRPDEPTLTVDNLEVAQYFHMLLNSKKVREVIDTSTSKTVLLMGRFTAARKIILDAIREELRKYNFVPILFDFEGPTNRDPTETILTLAHMCAFIIADLTDARSTLAELAYIVPLLPSVPVQPLLQSSFQSPAMLRDLSRYPWVLEPYVYHDLKDLVASLEKKVISPAFARAKESGGARY